MSSVYVREIINLANKFGVAAMIFAHNHPSGKLNQVVKTRRLPKNLSLQAGL
jgi:DNA repair protein RadC